MPKLSDKTVPHKSRVKRLKLTILAVVALIVAMYAGAVIGYSLKPAESAPVARITQQVPPSIPDVYGIWNLVNNQREKNGLAPLRLNEKLNDSALMKCKDMVAKNYWSHNDPSGREPWHFISENYGDYLTAGENLAEGYVDDQPLVRGWMNSAEHKKNILQPKYQDVGYAVCHSGNFIREGPRYIVVQHFASK